MVDRFTLHLGDSFEVLRTLPENSVDAVVTDPPYGIGFMGKSWDHADIVKRVEQQAVKTHQPAGPGGVARKTPRRAPAEEAGLYNLSPNGMRAFQVWTQGWAEQALRVLKPGGHVLCFASTRTYHRMAAGIEDAGFVVRDQLGWMFGSGFPKSRNLKGEWDGWGTGLKPGWEPICMARKPLEGTIEANLAAHGVGALHIDACRIPTTDKLGGGDNVAHVDRTGKHEGWQRPWMQDDEAVAQAAARSQQSTARSEALGRWPANLIHDGSEEVMALFPAEAGAASAVTGREPSAASAGRITGERHRVAGVFHADSGSAARFFYCAKASKRDRNEGLHPDDEDQRNIHPTVKPTDLMRYLCRLVTPPGGVVLDPFTGSGSTGKAAMLEGMRFIGIEREAAYLAIARERIQAATAPQPGDLSRDRAQPIDEEEAAFLAAQRELF